MHHFKLTNYLHLILTIVKNKVIRSVRHDSQGRRGSHVKEPETKINIGNIGNILSISIIYNHYSDYGNDNETHETINSFIVLKSLLFINLSSAFKGRALPL